MSKHQQLQQFKEPELFPQRRTTLANLTYESNSAVISQRARAFQNRLPRATFYRSSAAPEIGQLPG
ncbi:MAG TPA: hypothetical protein VN414_07060 [Methanosarcina sp.]|nr:hypothetical protein [Methanosarcina sp.]